MDERIRARVSGRVQGVWFRDTTRERATTLGLTGWVRNEPDGSVLLEAQGDEPARERLIAFLHEGPARAEVRDVSVEAIEPVDGELRFEIR